MMMMLKKEVEPAAPVEPQCPRGCKPETWKDTIGIILTLLVMFGMISIPVAAIAYGNGVEEGVARARSWDKKMYKKDLQNVRECVIERRYWLTDGYVGCVDFAISKQVE
jgi:hypothetical protein